MTSIVRELATADGEEDGRNTAKGVDVFYRTAPCRRFLVPFLLLFRSSATYFLFVLQHTNNHHNPYIDSTTVQSNIISVLSTSRDLTHHNC